MTAIVGILNSQAIALAADSAVTISSPQQNSRKVINNANKIFALSKFHPVGVMIYNNATFIGMPWETLIKVYRKQLAKKSFATLKEYTTDFFAFLKSKNFYADGQTKEQYLKHFFLEVTSNLIKNFGSGSYPNAAAFYEQALAYTKKTFQKCEDMQNLDKAYINALFIIFTEEAYKEEKDRNFIKDSFDVVFELLLSKWNGNNFTGLVFTGFGEEEIYPQLISYSVSFAIQNNMRYFEDKNVKITSSQEASLQPFAQRDIIDTILSGINPYLETSLQGALDIFITYLKDHIAQTIPETANKINSINNAEFINKFMSIHQENKNTVFIQPLLNTIASLPKEDLAEMAESLIHLTYLNRRMTSQEEGVGGDIDVAIITKGDGFIWIKRKHYFEAKLNQHFFNHNS